MEKRDFICLGLVILFLVNINSSYSSVTSKVCNATTKACVSNITNDLTVKDEELLQACKGCCELSQTHAPSSIKGSINSCIPRCKKSCDKAYKKAVAQLNMN